MTRKHYAVHTVRDEPVRLRDQLDHIAADGGRVVSVIWQPARQVTLATKATLGSHTRRPVTGWA
jgi:hypothetical protein